jgi:transposase-like protein/predicted DNA-binding protein YlxM (UPF0122 family)
MLCDKEKEKIKELRSKGFSYGKIAKLFNLSRSRIHQLCSGYEPGKLKNKSFIILYEQIKKRDNYTCQLKERCDSLEDIKLVIHHIDFNNKNNDTGNLITLCNLCHSYFHLKYRYQNDGINHHKICPECGNSFYNHLKKKYCSITCKQKANYREIMKLRMAGYKFREIAKIRHKHINSIMRYITNCKRKNVIIDYDMAA